MAGIQAWLGEGILACCKYVGLYSCDEQQKPISCRLSLPDGLLRIGIVNEEPPYAEPHVRWCERSENEVGRKLLRFPPTRSILYQLTEEEWILISSQFVMTLRKAPENDDNKKKVISTE